METKKKHESKAAAARREKAEAVEKLRKLIRPGDTIWTKLIHVSASGMYRVLNVYVIRDNEPLRITRGVADAAGAGYDKRHEGARAGGCGLDVGFALVYSLATTLYRGGFGCVGEGCPSNDHSNGDRDYTPHFDGCPRNSEEVGKDLHPHSHWHKDPGYALRHRWL